jgi:ferredoxin
VRATIAEGRCKGYGFCVDVAPDAYDLDLSGYNVLDGEAPRTVDPALREEAAAGAAACPVRALRLLEDDGAGAGGR